MQCMSCNTDIPASWVSCIQRNSCPACGKEIMNDKAKELLDEIREAINDMPNDPEGLAGWLLSNYKLIKVGDGEPVNFYGRAPAAIQHSSDGQPIRVNPNNKVQKFLKNTGLANQINATAAAVAGSKKPSVRDLVNRMHNDIEAEESALMNEYEEYDEHEEYDDYIAEYEQNRVSPSARSLANNWVPGGAPLSPEEKAAMQAAIGGSISEAGPSMAPMPSGQYSPNALHKVNNLHPALEQDRQNRNYLSANVGGGVGLIRRK